MSISREDYEASVRALLISAQMLWSRGLSDEAVARELVALRNKLKIQARSGLPDQVLRRLEARNLAKYGDAIGPTPEFLYERYGNWRAVIDASARPADLRKAPI